MRNFFLVGMVCIVALAGCGRKEMPQADSSEPLRLVHLTHQKAVSVLQLKFTILGGVGAVGYQVDRGEIDSHCNCITHWQRYYEQATLPRIKGKEQTRNLKLLDYRREFAFRIRAVDSMGNLGAWSEPIRARADKATK